MRATKLSILRDGGVGDRSRRVVVDNLVLLLVGLALVAVFAGSSSSAPAGQAAFYLRFVLCGVIALVGFIAAGGVHFGSRAMSIACVSLIVVAGASATWSVDPRLTLRYGLGFGVLVLAAFAANSEAMQIERIAKILVLGTAVLLATGLALAYAGFRLVYQVGDSDIPRVRGLLGNSNNVGLVAAIALPVLIALFWRQRGWRRAGWLVAAVAVEASLVLSQSRGGLLAATAGVAVLLLLARSLLTRGLLAVTVLILAIPFLLPPLVPEVAAADLPSPSSTHPNPWPIDGPRTDNDLEPEEVQGVSPRSALGRFSSETAGAAGSGRLVAWDLALDIWSERPLLGWGFGTSAEVFGPRARSIESEFVGSAPHNAFVQLLLELGPVGLILLLVAVSIVLKCVIALPVDWLNAGLGGTFVAALSTQFVEGGLISPGSVGGFMFWFASAAVVRRAKASTEDRVVA